MAIVSVLMAGIGGQDPQKADQDRIQGTWTVIRATVGSARGVLESHRQERRLFEGDKSWVIVDGVRAKGGASFTLDPTKSPHTIDMQSGENKFLGIYEFDGKRLRICYNLKTRPTHFDPTEHDGDHYNIFYEFERK
jgi:uncharacterized protein (TIGR03067 family)